MLPNMNLNWLRSFEAAARLLSFTAAAQETGLTQTAISQHIKALEAKLGQKLFIRRPKSLLLTDIGRAYLLSVRDALEMIEMSTSGLFGPNPESTITLRASMAFIAWLSPRLGGFQAARPDVAVKLVTAIWDSPADKQPVDIDITLAPHGLDRPGLEKLADERLIPITAASAPVADLAALTRRSPIHILGFDDHWARYLAAFGAEHETAPRLLTDTSVAATEMVAAGLGCAVVIERFARQAVAAGRGVVLAGEPVALGQSHFLTLNRGRGAPKPAARAFADWLRTQF